jgi:hypothetical protein
VVNANVMSSQQRRAHCTQVCPPTVLGSSRYTTRGLPMKEMATDRRRFMPPEYFPASLSPTPLLNRLTAFKAVLIDSSSSPPACVSQDGDETLLCPPVPCRLGLR